jgi:hypothetical protein
MKIDNFSLNVSTRNCTRGTGKQPASLRWLRYAFVPTHRAELTITGTVQKVANLILNMNIYVRDASSGATIAAMSAECAAIPMRRGHARSIGWFTIGFSRLAIASSVK